MEKLNDSIRNLLKVLEVVKVVREFTISGKYRIRASFLRVDVRYWVRSKIFNSCDLPPWCICCFFEKHSGRMTIFISKTSVQTERRNNAAIC